MRVYRSDGSFVDDPTDDEFGWFLEDIIIDEASKNYEKRNREMKMKSFSRKHFFSDSEDNFVKPAADEIPVNIIDPGIEIHQAKNFVNCEDIMNNLSSICLAEEMINIENEKNKLASIMSPCSIEAKTLLSVIHYTKYKGIEKKQASEELLRSVNFKSTNLKFLLSEKKSEIESEFPGELDNSKHLKEDNMRSLMMDLISTDMDINLDHLSDKCSTIEHTTFPKFVIDTSDLGNSIPSSSSSREEKCDTHFLQIPQDRSNILCSLGLSDEQQSIQNYCEETFEMHKELAHIKRCFKVSQFIIFCELDNSISLQNDRKSLKDTKSIFILYS